MDDVEKWVHAQVGRVIGGDAAGAWLRRPNSHLDGKSPVELLRKGEGERVRDLVVALIDGTYL